MNGRNFAAQLISFFLFIALQIFFVRNLVLFDVAFCFAYIGFLLLLPFEIGVINLMLIGFSTGLIVDIFYDSLGLHTFACVLVTYIRNSFINLITPKGGLDNIPNPNLAKMGHNWFAIYAITLIFVHHFTLFFIEAGGFNLFFFTISKVIASTIFTYTLIVIVQFLFYPSKRIA
jgi:hypothetical protein